VPSFQTFKDLSITFKPHPVTEDVLVKKDAAAIRQSVSNLLYTRKTERPFDYNIGTNLYNLLFEPLNSITAGLIATEIRTVITQYEPRIVIDNIEVSANFSDNGFDVLLSYIIVGRDDDSIDLNLFLERL
jgi:phage baseplate assembly protein W